MDALAGPLHLFAVVLVVSGTQKLLSPRPAADAMRAGGLPLRDTARGAAVGGVLLGAVETTTGLAAVAVPHALAAGWLGVFYLALAGFVVRLRRRDATAGCGCFGAAATPPGTMHIVVDVTAGVLALLTAATGVPDITTVVGAGLGVAVPYVTLLATGAGLVLLAPVLLADLARIPGGPAMSRSLR